FTIRRERDTSAAVTVNYRVWGTADNGIDYDALSGTVTIPAGESSVGVPITPRNDDTTEGCETVNLTLIEGDYAFGASTEATVYITDNGSTNSVFVNATADMASENGTSHGEFTITRTGSTDRGLTVQYTIEGTADNGDDYDPIEGSATIPSGESSVVVEVAPIQDDSIEGDETVIMSLIPLYDIPDEEADDYVIGYPSAATVTIIDADYTVVSVAVADDEAAEGDVPDTAVFTIARVGDTTSDLTVNYTMEGTAQNGVDYDFLSGVAVIPAGQTSVSVTVSPVDDSDVEANESVVISLGEGSYSLGLADTAAITIWDDEQTSLSWHVSVDSGNDLTGDGSETAPWSTIGHAIARAALVATDANPVTIHLAEGTYEEPVVLVPHVSLVGAGSDLTTIQYYNETDMEHVVITGAEACAISGCTLTLQGDYDDVTVLLSVDDVVVNVTDCVFDGNDNELCTAIKISGTGSSDSVVSGCTITDVGTGIWAEYTGVTVTRNLFENISGNAVYVLPVIAKASDTPYLGGFDNGRVSGMNRFRDIGGLFVQNHSGSEVHAGYNDWGVYSAEDISKKMGGNVDFDNYLTEEIAEGMLFIQLVDEATGEAIAAGANPSVVIDGGAVTVEFDPESNMFTATGLEGTYTVEASADGYEPADSEVVVPAGEPVVKIVQLAPEPDVPGDVDGSGIVNAIDVQLVINEALGIDTGRDCDINGDTRIDAVDVQLVINAALGIAI
ncbi:MAG: right-handed parallel beta-helix repeat-containing protein, partial [Candidatus Hydrogenedentes bacterium]|nr:right-handed parallel beta-helix repeat-containing protein [Candidatus Hydrogenedentota bacterium]